MERDQCGRRSDRRGVPPDPGLCNGTGAHRAQRGPASVRARCRSASLGAEGQRERAGRTGPERARAVQGALGRGDGGREGRPRGWASAPGTRVGHRPRRGSQAPAVMGAGEWSWEAFSMAAPPVPWPASEGTGRDPGQAPHSPWLSPHRDGQRAPAEQAQSLTRAVSAGAQHRVCRVMDSVTKAWTIWEGRLLKNDPARI